MTRQAWSAGACFRLCVPPRAPSEPQGQPQAVSGLLWDDPPGMECLLHPVPHRQVTLRRAAACRRGSSRRCCACSAHPPALPAAGDVQLPGTGPAVAGGPGRHLRRCAGRAEAPGQAPPGRWGVLGPERHLAGRHLRLHAGGPGRPGARCAASRVRVLGPAYCRPGLSVWLSGGRCCGMTCSAAAACHAAACPIRSADAGLAAHAPEACGDSLSPDPGASVPLQAFAAKHPTSVAPLDAVLFTGFVAALVPRALATGDSMYFIDVGWNSALGVCQLLVLARRAPSGDPAGASTAALAASKLPAA